MSRLVPTIQGWAIGTAVLGGLLAYSGLRGKRITATLRAVITGRDPNQVPVETGIPVPPVNANMAPSSMSISGAATPGQLTNASGKRQIVVSAGLSQQGKPYVWDSPVNFSNPDPRGFDCSGLTGWCYEKVGINLPHYTGSQFNTLPHADISAAQPGDLIFWADVTIHHVALYVGNGQIVEAPDFGIPVRVRNLSLSESGLLHTIGVMPGG